VFAERLGVTVMTLRTMRKTGRAPAPLGRVRIRLVWDAADVDHWIENRAAGRTSMPCVVAGCTRTVRLARDGRCSEHSVVGDLLGHDDPRPLPVRSPGATLAERHASWTVLDPETGCMLWAAATA
jgi:hypothetical protein